MASHAKRSCRLLLTLLLFQALMDSAAPACSINAIYSFGDSIADTGNLLREGPVGFFASIGSYPYGETFQKPTGRCSDGLLIIDYFGTRLRSPCMCAPSIFTVQCSLRFRSKKDAL